MAYLTQVGTTTTANTSLTVATLVHTQTNTTRIRKLWVNIFADQVKGNGDYIAYITKQRGGAGSFYESIRTTKAAAAGITSIEFDSIALIVNATDVVKVYLLGLATDSDNTADVIVDVNEEWQDTDANGALLLQPTQTGVTIPTVTTLTNAPLDSSGVTTLLSRLGAFTGTGVNTVLGFLKSLASKVATLPSDIGGTFDPATDSLEKISGQQTAATDPLTNNVPGSYLTGSAGYTLGHLNDSGVTVLASVDGGEINVYRGSDWSIALTALGNLTGYTKLYFTVKRNITDSDADALVQIEKTLGLTRLNGSGTVTALDGSITISSEPLGNITIALKAASSSVLPIGTGWNYDIKLVTASGVTILADGRSSFNILPDVTRKVS